jgi:hypothetical protein
VTTVGSSSRGPSLLRGGCFKVQENVQSSWPSMLKVIGLNLIKTNVNFEQRYLWVSTQKYHVLKELINYKQLKENINENDKQIHVEDKNK